MRKLIGRVLWWFLDAAPKRMTCVVSLSLDGAALDGVKDEISRLTRAVEQARQTEIVSVEINGGGAGGAGANRRPSDPCSGKL